MGRGLAVRKRPITDYKLAVMQDKLSQKFAEMNEILSAISSIYNNSEMEPAEKKLKIDELVVRLEKLQYDE